jgi:uncharacterized protein YcfJ
MKKAVWISLLSAASYLAAPAIPQSTYEDSSQKQAQKHEQRKKTVKHVGVGAVGGTVIGAIAGGGKGAAIGALAGGGSGYAYDRVKKHNEKKKERKAEE